MRKQDGNSQLFHKFDTKEKKTGKGEENHNGRVE